MGENKSKEEVNLERRIELSRKFLEMGSALIKEGDETEFNTISQAGGVMTLLAGVILDDDDLNMFQYMCSMFSAKKVMDSMSKLSPLNSMMGAPTSKNSALEILKDMLGEIKGGKDDDDDSEDSE